MKEGYVGILVFMNDVTIQHYMHHLSAFILVLRSHVDVTLSVIFLSSKKSKYLNFEWGYTKSLLGISYISWLEGHQVENIYLAISYLRIFTAFYREVMRLLCYIRQRPNSMTLETLTRLLQLAFKQELN